MSMTTQELSTHDVLLDFGMYKGERLTRVPIGYIRWMLGTPNLDPRWQALARSESARRGTAPPTIELSDQAIDHASLRMRKLWHDTALNDQEGLYSWLMRVTAGAIEEGEHLPDGRFKYMGMEFTIEPGDEFSRLKAITG